MTKAIIAEDLDKISQLAGGALAVVYYTKTGGRRNMLVASNIGGAGLGTFKEGPVATGCADGSDFICGPKGGIFSCRPCDFSQLEAFKDLQKLANQLVVSLGLANTPAIITGEHSVAGGDILAIDGRIGPATKSTIAKIVRIAGPRLMAPTDPLLAMSKFKTDYEYISHVAPELRAYFSQLVKLSNAPKDVPAPKQQPIKRVTAPGSVPVPGAAPSDRTKVRPGMSRAGLTVGIFGVLAAVGLVGTGVYYYRSQG